MKVRIAQEVQTALDRHLPIVALESTIIAHGMPYPQNVETALKVEAEIRAFNAIPATIGIIEGVCVIGMSQNEIEAFGRRKDIIKVSRRDISVIIAQKKWGATTVAATMFLAHLTGIKVFVTGGIGGVHRGAEMNMDISADLQELAHSDVAVICAGPKAILDLGLTLEYLETNGVPLIGYQTANLPAFYSSSSPYPVDYRLDTPEEIASVMREKWDLHLQGGILITNPIPKEYALDYALMEEVIKKALQQAKINGIHGKALTPFLLHYIKEETQGESLQANIALILNNAKLGAKIACAYQAIKNQE